MSLPLPGRCPQPSPAHPDSAHTPALPTRVMPTPPLCLPGRCPHACPGGALTPALPAGLEDDPPAVLQTVRRYVHTFFGCRECGEHFENMAKESLDTVKTADQAILWLWRAHNAVNGRLAGEGQPGVS